jgi:hypothetical protein
LFPESINTVNEDPAPPEKFFPLFTSLKYISAFLEEPEIPKSPAQDRQADIGNQVRPKDLVR